MTELLINVNQVVHLLNWENIEVLVEDEKFRFMIKHWFFDGSHENIHHLLIKISTWRDVEAVNEDSNLKGIILQTDDEELNELLMSDLILFRFLKLRCIVFFAVHTENDIDILCCLEEPFSVVLGYSWFNVVVDYDFLIVGLVIDSVCGCLHGLILLSKYSHVDFDCVLHKRKLNQFIVSFV